ncbi:MAG: hypothetical protein OEV91_00095 [Desulfobulbaceae bacterium]|nr:hypothetical protein [Desulfobulbaceae bacterium]
MRLLIATLVTALGRHLIVSAPPGIEGVSSLLLAMLCFVVAAFVFAPGVARLLAELFVGDLCFRDGFGASSRPNYLIAADKRARGQHEEAMAVLAKIATEHPRELRVYLEMLDIAAAELDEPLRVRQVYGQGKAALRRKEDLAVLASAYRKCGAGQVPGADQS